MGDQLTVRKSHGCGTNPRARDAHHDGEPADDPSGASDTLYCSRVIHVSRSCGYIGSRLPSA